MNSVLFVTAMRKKLRFPTRKGNISTEDLWEFDLVSLDKVAVALDSEMEALKKSFVKKSKDTSELELKLEVVKEVIRIKEDELHKPGAAQASEPENKIIL